VEAKYLSVNTSELSKPAQVGNLPLVITELTEFLQGFRVQLVENECHLKEYDLSSLDIHLLAIKNIMGERTVDTDPRTIMEHLEALSQQLKDQNKVLLTEVEQQGIAKQFKDYTPYLSGFVKGVYLGCSRCVQVNV